MPDFRYTATAADGRPHQGLLAAATQAELIERLKDLGLTFVQAELTDDPSLKLTWSERLATIPAVAKVFFTQNLRVMIHAGLPIGRALDTLAGQVGSKRLAKVIRAIRRDVEGGQALSAALAKHPDVFPELYVAMVAAGEASGQLDDVLIRLSAQLKKQYTLRARVRNALIYPLVVLVGMVAVSLIMLIVVLPQITGIFEETGGALPAPTRVLIATSDFLLHRWWVAISALALIVTALVLANRSVSGRRNLHRFWLRLPIVGPIIRKVSLASFLRSLSSLLATDLPIIQTFKIIARTISNRPYHDAILEAADQLKAGATVVRSLERHRDLFPPIATQMISVGEESGTLEAVTSEVATFYEEDVDQTMANLSTILEPLIILLLGVGVTALALAVILPLYSLGSQLG